MKRIIITPPMEPLPRKPRSKLIGESRAMAVKRFLHLERSLHAKDQFKEFSSVVNEYFELNHAELVPLSDLAKPPKEVFYLPMHAVRKDSSTTTKLRVVFDVHVSAKSSSGISLNDTLLVGRTIHSPLMDVLIRFRRHQIPLTADVSKMYRAIHLHETDRVYHRFVWRDKQDEPLRDYQMIRATFGVSASSHAANMSLRQNASNHIDQFPLAAKSVMEDLYVDDCLSGADTLEEAVKLRKQFLDLFD